MHLALLPESITVQKPIFCVDVAFNACVAFSFILSRLPVRRLRSAARRAIQKQLPERIGCQKRNEVLTASAEET